MTGIAGRAVYGISKAGLIQMTRMLAIEWAPHGVRANAVAPATVLTPSREGMLADPQARARMLSRIPSGRFVTPEEVAAAVVFLASPRSGRDHRAGAGGRWRADGAVRGASTAA